MYEETWTLILHHSYSKKASSTRDSVQESANFSQVGEIGEHLKYKMEKASASSELFK